ncbi:hypothetical protein N9J39_01035 [Flavicella sp.]|nr:hypothetical protein [Flavicella sp.]MDA9111440.1 hypothetical protein [Flavicella sp.]
MNFKIKLTTFFAIAMSTLAFAQSSPWTSSRADGHAPLGVMGDHVHHKGEWMTSYRLMDMQMEGMLKGSKTIENSELFNEYMMAPQDMSMQMHMLGIMYAPTDRLTLVAMANFLRNEMTSKKMMGAMRMESEGFGDLKVGALFQLFNKDRRSMLLNIGVSVPVGSLEETKADGTRLGYPMQLGSGTWDANLGFTYLKQFDQFSCGFQSTYLTRMGENSEGYTLGDTWNSSLWGAFSFSKQASVSLRIKHLQLQSIKGKDSKIGMSAVDSMVGMPSMSDKPMTPVFNPANSGKTTSDIFLGFNYGLFKGPLKGVRFATEVGVPLAQKVTGIQMKNTLVFVSGIQYAFGGH